MNNLWPDSYQIVLLDRLRLTVLRRTRSLQRISLNAETRHRYRLVQSKKFPRETNEIRKKKHLDRNSNDVANLPKMQINLHKINPRRHLPRRLSQKQVPRICRKLNLPKHSVQLQRGLSFDIQRTLKSNLRVSLRHRTQLFRRTRKLPKNLSTRQELLD